MDPCLPKTTNYLCFKFWMLINWSMVEIIKGHQRNICYREEISFCLAYKLDLRDIALPPFYYKQQILFSFSVKDCDCSINPVISILMKLLTSSPVAEFDNNISSVCGHSGIRVSLRKNWWTLGGTSCQIFKFRNWWEIMN